jgi:Uma2 family endonuclease
MRGESVTSTVPLHATLARARYGSRSKEGHRMAVAAQTKRWTLRELHRLPDDGNKYELVHGELFVTPSPSEAHEAIAVRLHEILAPYVKAQDLGHIYRPRAVLQRKGSEAEPDLMVRRAHPGSRKSWASAPIPSLVIEIISPSTRRRDYGPKKDFYMEVGVPEYWIVDEELRAITVVRRGTDDVTEDVTVTERLTWIPAGTEEPLSIDVATLFDD